MTGSRGQYAKRTDLNHAEIRSTLRGIGVHVFDASATGNGFPDLLCMFRGGIALVEVKNGNRPPSARKLTIEQVRFHEAARLAGVTIHVVKNTDEALALFGARAA